MTHIAIPALLALALAGTTVQAQKSKTRHTTRTTVVKKSTSSAPTWRTVYTDPTLTVSVDPKGTTHATDGSYTTHLRWAYAADQSIGRDKAYRTMVETRILDCDSLRSKPVRATTYTSTGKVISTYDTKPADVPYLSWGTRKPGTANANAIAGVCKMITTKA